MKILFKLVCAVALLGTLALTLAAPADAAGATPSASASASAQAKPTIVLVHGAFAESASWNDVARALRAQHYPVIAAANPLRGLKYDADHVGALLASIQGPVVLVGHSYGGSVISAAAAGKANVRALVYVAAFAPEAGEAAVDISARFPGSTLDATLLPPVVQADGAKDLYIQQDKFPAQYAADVAPALANLMALTQRPIAAGAFSESVPAVAWKNVPSWFIYGDADKCIPPSALGYMATRAKSVKTVVVKGGSHAVMASNPKQVASLIVEAANAIGAAARP
ncbi:alpha/beta fold hydrolase [Bordetella sp. LUAb4]|uniref:alpha/beta fold hydrolase n=1 Tax=Bordetella sp. LUAb4 TaxID=2843195 RepID=UPI001E483E56|nr:alpha/beta hydrolase [Bordetella sp. LUAb4]